MIRAADDAAFRESRRIFTLSPTGADRLRRYNGFAAEILPQPLNDPELFPGGEAEGYILASGRVGRGKRQHLLVEAMRHAPRVRLVVAGPAGPAGGRRTPPPARPRQKAWRTG